MTTTRGHKRTFDVNTLTKHGGFACTDSLDSSLPIETPSVKIHLDQQMWVQENDRFFE